MKFKNNYDYPILLRVSNFRDTTHQYHNVFIYSAGDAPKRDVEFYDWKKWDEWSPTQFKGSFKRNVIENGALLFQDEFTSWYYN
ncbi:MAG: hypothetical protein Q9M91_03170 [Candidatus Dojkabacteria bacterium]|nr:hypothetical protein [Candidatus Dojkabacteria bacterium]